MVDTKNINQVTSQEYYTYKSGKKKLSGNKKLEI